MTESLQKLKHIMIISDWIIVQIDSITWSLCLCHVCKTVYLIWVRKLDQHCVKVTPSQDLPSEILNEINNSCYTEYKKHSDLTNLQYYALDDHWFFGYLNFEWLIRVHVNSNAYSLFFSTELLLITSHNQSLLKGSK